LAGRSLFRFCFILSLCLHFGFSFFPFFGGSQTTQAHSPKFLEVAFLKNKVNKHLLARKNESKELPDKQEKPQLSSDSLRPVSEIINRIEISRATQDLPLPVSRKKKNDNKKADIKTVVITDSLELDLGDDGVDFFPALFADYAHILRAYILENIVYPQAAFRKNMEGSVQLKFVLSPDGNLKDIYILKSSNCLILDVAALDAVEKASPFPSFPKNLNAKELFVKVPIVYKLN